MCRFSLIANLKTIPKIMSTYIRTLTIFFDTNIGQKEIPFFRGAILNSLGENANILYHNHLGGKSLRYSYPLIQYKRLNGKAVIVCVKEGVDIIGQLFSTIPNSIMIGQREARCNVIRIKPTRILIRTWKTLFNYHLNCWLPLNSKNYKYYKSAESDIERKRLLENILAGNVLSMLKGLGIRLEDRLIVNITQLSQAYIIYNKDVAMMAFNVDFCSNLSIPNNLGIGKNASIGCGVIHQKKKDNQQTEE